MKKIILTLMLLLGLGSSMAFADTYAHDDSVLPAAAKAVIKKNFKAKVSVVKIEKDFGRVSEYEVVLNDGSEVSFDRDGNWKDVEVGSGMKVPEAFVPKAARDYIKANHKGVNVVGVERGRKDYEVKLANGIEMKFANDGRFIRYED